MNENVPIQPTDGCLQTLYSQLCAHDCDELYCLLVGTASAKFADTITSPKESQ
mgnify:CR=1 FL=1